MGGNVYPKTEANPPLQSGMEEYQLLELITSEKSYTKAKLFIYSFTFLERFSKLDL